MKTLPVYNINFKELNTPETTQNNQVDIKQEEQPKKKDKKRI